MKYKFFAARPHWLKRPRDHVVGVEDGALIECIADGIPEPKVDWFINGVPINGKDTGSCI